MLHTPFHNNSSSTAGESRHSLDNALNFICMSSFSTEGGNEYKAVSLNAA
eukprot:m.11339 g.11339  ORF g.11339 m.11339 type:complete len:50 (-) comp6881_c0_seq2:1282-1431(-)